MTGIVIGVDTGASGAISIIIDNQLVSCEDMPTDPVIMKHNGKDVTRFRVSPHRLANILRPFADNHHIQGVFKMVVELPTYRPMIVKNRETGRSETRHPGSLSVAGLAESVGLVRGMAACFHIPFHGITSGNWKRALNAPADKQACRRKAQEVFPRWAQHFARARDDGRAESALIAFYGWTITTTPEA